MWLAHRAGKGVLPVPPYFCKRSRKGEKGPRDPTLYEGYMGNGRNAGERRNGKLLRGFAKPDRALPIPRRGGTQAGTPFPVGFLHDVSQTQARSSEGRTPLAEMRSANHCRVARRHEESGSWPTEERAEKDDDAGEKQRAARSV